MQHILSARQFDQGQLEQLFRRVIAMRVALTTPQGRVKLAKRHAGAVVATIFYEPSTRTRLSFESAAERLGASIISTENAKEFSSAIKGESIEDTVRVLASYADVIIIRHHETGAADAAAAVSSVPIINAGDGKGEHPTQALLDAFTILDEKGRLSNLKVVIGGDLKHGRTVRSLAQMLSLYESNEITFVSTAQLQIGGDIKTHLKQHGTKFHETDDLYVALKDADVVYWTRLQKERLDDPKVAAGFTIDQAALQVMPEDAIIMHPLPRVDEIEASVDNDKRAKYFVQAANGLYVRMALLDALL